MFELHIGVRLAVCRLLAFWTMFCAAAGGASLEDYDVAWDSPGSGSADSMPLGNGDVGVNVWTEGNGDLVFYISKTDSWDDNSRLLKVGRVRVRPALKGAVAGFRQVLRLREGMVSVRYVAGGEEVMLKIWVDANRPVIHVTAENGRAMGLEVSAEVWRTERRELATIECSDIYLDRSKPDTKHAATIVEPDTVLKGQKGRIGWYHHNVKSVGPEVTMRIQGLLGYELADPILYRTFGAVIAGEGARRVDDVTLRFGPAKEHLVSVYVLTEQPSEKFTELSVVQLKPASFECGTTRKSVSLCRRGKRGIACVLRKGLAGPQLGTMWRCPFSLPLFQRPVRLENDAGEVAHVQRGC